MTDQLTEEEEKTKSLNKLKNKQEAIIADLEGEPSTAAAFSMWWSLLLTRSHAVKIAETDFGFFLFRLRTQNRSCKSWNSSGSTF